MFEVLKKVAVYGAVISVSGCTVLYYLIQRKLASSGYYIATIEALKENERAKNLLGEPLRFQTLRLNDSHNRITTEHAQIAIPVSGSKSSGYIYSYATHYEGKWHLNSVILNFKGRPEKIVIKNDKSAITNE